MSEFTKISNTEKRHLTYYLLFSMAVAAIVGGGRAGEVVLILVIAVSASPFVG
jgi:hypothetical protein